MMSKYGCLDRLEFVSIPQNPSLWRRNKLIFAQVPIFEYHGRLAVAGFQDEEVCHYIWGEWKEHTSKSTAQADIHYRSVSWHLNVTIVK